MNNFSATIPCAVDLMPSLRDSNALAGIGTWDLRPRLMRAVASRLKSPSLRDCIHRFQR
ncbi:MAG: hypothetical protein ACTHK7_17940 [Aureliella sp.]